VSGMKGRRLTSKKERLSSRVRENAGTKRNERETALLRIANREAPILSQPPIQPQLAPKTSTE